MKQYNENEFMDLWEGGDILGLEYLKETELYNKFNELDYLICTLYNLNIVLDINYWQYNNILLYNKEINNSDYQTLENMYSTMKTRLFELLEIKEG